MKPVSKGTAKLKISETGEIFSFQPEELDWDVEGVDERSMGSESVHTALIEFGSSKSGKTYEASWQLWEYPQGVENDSATKVSDGIELVQDFEFHLEHEPESEDEERD